MKSKPLSQRSKRVKWSTGNILWHFWVIFLFLFFVVLYDAIIFEVIIFSTPIIHCLRYDRYALESLFYLFIMHVGWSYNWVLKNEKLVLTSLYTVTMIFTLYSDQYLSQIYKLKIFMKLSRCPNIFLRRIFTEGVSSQ